MALKRLRFYIISSFLLFLLSPSLFGQRELQVDSLFKQVFDANLKSINSSKLVKGSKPLILVSITPCSACVQYFSKRQRSYQFVFIINNKSLLEINRILAFYGLKSKNVYFVTVDDLIFNKKTIITGPTPLAFVKSKGMVTYMDYPTLFQTTKEFTAPHTDVLKSMRSK